MQHVSHFLPTYVDYQPKKSSIDKRKEEQRRLLPRVFTTECALRAPLVRTYQTQKCLGFEGAFGPPVWKHETCGGRLVTNNLQEDPSWWKMGGALRNVVFDLS